MTIIFQLNQYKVFFDTSLNKIFPNNSILLKMVLIHDWLNNPTTSSFLINLDFLLLHMEHFDSPQRATYLVCLIVQPFLLYLVHLIICINPLYSIYLLPKFVYLFLHNSSNNSYSFFSLILSFSSVCLFFLIIHLFSFSYSS